MSDGFAWVSVPISTCFGTVRSLNWDYMTRRHEEQAAPEDGAGAVRGKARLLSDDECVGLQDAEDELGSVLWNSNAVCCTEVRRLVQQSMNTPLTKRSDDELAGWNVIELGSGVGALGVALALGGARVLVTDIPRLVPAMNTTVALNSKDKLTSTSAVARVSVCGFDWTQPLPTAVTHWFRSRSKGTPVLVVLCDALYGNSKYWPALLDRLHAIWDVAQQDDSSTSPSIIRGLNICEQRVAGVEDGFLALMRNDTRAAWDVTTMTLDKASELGIPIRSTVFMRRDKRPIDVTPRRRRPRDEEEEVASVSGRSRLQP